MGKNERKFIVVGLGEILWDILPDGRQLGGAPANFGYHSQALGAEGIVASCIGDDQLGKEIITRLSELGLNCDYITVDKEHPTGTVTVRVDSEGKPQYTIHEDVAWDYIRSNRRLLGLAGRADAVCFGSLCQRCDVSRRTIHEFLAATKPDCICVFDINLRQSYFSREIIETSLERASVLKLNDEELPVVAEMLDIKGSEIDILSRLTTTYNLRIIALTRGARGSLLFTKGERCDYPGLPTKVVDTVGAGDAFAAALTIGLLRGRSLDEISEFANQVASFVCSHSGATPKLPDSLTRHFNLMEG